MQIQPGSGNAQREGGQALVVEGLDLLVGEHDLKQGRPAGIGEPWSLMDEQTEGEVLVIQPVGYGATDAAQVFVKPGVPVSALSGIEVDGNRTPVIPGAFSRPPEYRVGLTTGNAPGSAANAASRTVYRLAPCDSPRATIAWVSVGSR